MGSVTQLMAKHDVSVRRGRKEIHRDQALVERFNRTLAERLFGYQYAKELENSAQTEQRMGKEIAGSDQSHKFGDEKKTRQ